MDWQLTAVILTVSGAGLYLARSAWRAWKAEATLRGAPATEEAFSRAAETELADAQPLPGNAFKVPLARNLIVRTLLDLLQTPEEARP